VDQEDHFAGVITRTDSLDWARVKLRAIFRKPLTDTDKAIRLAKLINAVSVGDILRPETKNTAVFASDSLALALQKMIVTDSIILPVIDESQYIIGSLTLSELLNRVLVEDNQF
jgi:CBS-domain-containing membrane protein